MRCKYNYDFGVLYHVLRLTSCCLSSLYQGTDVSLLVVANGAFKI